MKKEHKTSKRGLQKKPGRDMPDDPKELARAIFRAADRKLQKQRKSPV